MPKTFDGDDAMGILIDLDLAANDADERADRDSASELRDDHRALVRLFKKLGLIDVDRSGISTGVGVVTL